jgi:hypothetical protein
MAMVAAVFGHVLEVVEPAGVGDLVVVFYELMSVTLFSDGATNT